MDRVTAMYDGATRALDDLGGAVLPLAARFVFAAVLLFYFWASALTKVGPGVLGPFMPSDGAYIQIFPKTTEAFGYDFSQFGVFHWAVAVAGTVAEFVLPLLILVGLFTRLAALGMIGFVVVQSVVDVVGHGTTGATLGALFDRASGALIWDQRMLWVFLLLVLVVKGGGALSLDQRLNRGLGRVWRARSQGS